MSSIVIGKHTLESLTSGMYSDPYVVFRETSLDKGTQRKTTENELPSLSLIHI